MSVKIMGLVWDADLEASDKFVLLAYADHANHEGFNIYPSVLTVAAKTGMSERSVQRSTRRLEVMGYLIQDGTGRFGTNKWRIPVSAGGDKLSPVTNCQGDKSASDSGDKSASDSGDTVSPEPLTLTDKEDIYRDILRMLDFDKPHLRKRFLLGVNGRVPELLGTPGNEQLVIYCVDQDAAESYQARYSKVLQRAAAGVYGHAVDVLFSV